MHFRQAYKHVFRIHLTSNYLTKLSIFGCNTTPGTPKLFRPHPQNMIGPSARGSGKFPSRIFLTSFLLGACPILLMNNFNKSTTGHITYRQRPNAIHFRIQPREKFPWASCGLQFGHPCTSLFRHFQALLNINIS